MCSGIGRLSPASQPPEQKSGQSVDRYASGSPVNGYQKHCTATVGKNKIFFRLTFPRFFGTIRERPD